MEKVKIVVQDLEAERKLRRQPELESTLESDRLEPDYASFDLIFSSPPHFRDFLVAFGLLLFTPYYFGTVSCTQF